VKVTAAERVDPEPESEFAGTFTFETAILFARALRQKKSRKRKVDTRLSVFISCCNWIKLNSGTGEKSLGFSQGKFFQLSLTWCHRVYDIKLASFIKTI